MVVGGRRMMRKFTLSGVLSAAFLVLAALPAFAANEAPKRQQPPGQIAFHERQKKCAAEWHEAKAQGKIPPGMTWPKFWSACNTRLKAQSK